MLAPYMHACLHASPPCNTLATYLVLLLHGMGAQDNNSLMVATVQESHQESRTLGVTLSLQLPLDFTCLVGTCHAFLHVKALIDCCGQVIVSGKL